MIHALTDERSGHIIEEIFKLHWRIIWLSKLMTQHLMLVF